MQVNDNEITVQWYDTKEKGKNYGYGRFELAKSVGKNMKEEIILKETVICDFKNLNKENKIPQNVLKILNKNSFIKWKI